MLLELKIENFGIIESVTMRCGPGLNIITGETGSGKSLVLQSIDAVLGARVGTGIVRNGASRAVVEAIYDLSALQSVRDWLSNHSYPAEEPYLTIRREIAVDGKSRSLINGVSTRIGVLRGLAPYLMEIHGQHEHQRLLEAESHLDSLDSFGSLHSLRNSVSELYYKFHNLQKRLRAVTLEAGEKEQRLDFLRFALDEIESFEPRTGEFEDAEHVRAMIQNSGKLYRDFSGAYSIIREEEDSIMDRLNGIEGLLEIHVDLHPGLVEQVGELREAIFRLENLTDYLRSEREKFQFSPEQLEDLEERLHGYKKLYKKYGGSTESVLNMRDEFLRELTMIEMSDEEAELLESEMEVVYSELLSLAEDLSRKRRSLIPILEEKLAGELHSLGMPGARIQISVTREMATDVPRSNTSPGKQYSIHEKGLDRVEFLLQANAGEKVLPLRKVASGGELSRIMLALKSIVMESQPVGAVIFDEIDTGVGGEIAHAIGDRLKKIAAQGQVMVVTHLHQIAGLGDHHFRIFKQLKEGRTRSFLQHLQGEPRLKELARMLGGESSAPAVMQHARQILEKKVG